MNDANLPSVLIVGGGIAGSTCALALARQGVDVHLAEQKRFPRDKACGCCIGAAGLGLLQQLSLRQAVLDQGAPTNRWIASIGSRRIEIAIPDGVAISRRIIDPLILNSAIAAGATVFPETTARVLSADRDGVDVMLKSDAMRSQRRFDLVVVAAGLSAVGLSDILPWIEKPHGPFGVSCMVECDRFEPGAIYMACDDDGYVGMVRLTENRVDVAAALSSGSTANRSGTPLERMQGILDRSVFQSPMFKDASPLWTTPPLRRTRLFGNGRVIAIGDAAGYVEPFTGEGMTWAMLGAIEAADLITTMGNSPAIGERWQRQLTELLRDKKRMCRMITGACRSKLVRGGVGRLLTAFPSLSRPFLSHLNQL